MPLDGQSGVLVVGRREDFGPLLLSAPAGATFRVDFIADVYSAMALLARGAPMSRVLVDVRGLPADELAFVSLAPRYFPRVRIDVAELDGTAEWLRAADLAIRPIALERFVAECAAGSPLLRPAAVAGSRPVPPKEKASPAPLSTDGLEPQSPDELALHEAVRMRMGGGDPRVVRRRPPGAPAAGPAATGKSPTAPPEQQLSSEELNALLAGSPDAAEAATDPDDRHGGSEP